LNDDKLRRFYNLWWEFLKRSELYKSFCIKFRDLTIPLNRLEINASLLNSYEFFGDVFRGDFETWWFCHGQGIKEELLIWNSVISFDVDTILACFETAFDAVKHLLTQKTKREVNKLTEKKIRKRGLGKASLNELTYIDSFKDMLYIELAAVIDVELRKRLTERLEKEFHEEASRIDAELTERLEKEEFHEEASRMVAAPDIPSYQFFAVDVGVVPPRRIGRAIEREITRCRQKIKDKQKPSPYYDFLPPPYIGNKLDDGEESLLVYDYRKKGKTWKEIVKELFSDDNYTETNRIKAWRRYQRAEELIQNVEKGFLF